MLSESPCCWGGSRCWGDRAAGSSGDRQWLARSGGAGAKEEKVGRKTRCRAPGSRSGGCRPRGSGESPPFAWRPKPAAIRHVGEEQGTGDSLRLPSTRGATAVRQEAEEHRAVHQDVQYHRMAPRVNRSAGWGPSGSVSGDRWVAKVSFHYHLLHRPRSVPTGSRPRPTRHNNLIDLFILVYHRRDQRVPHPSILAVLHTLN